MRLVSPAASGDRGGWGLLGEQNPETTHGERPPFGPADRFGAGGPVPRRRGLPATRYYSRAYVSVGDSVAIQPYCGEAFTGVVTKVYRNRRGRVSYYVLPRGKRAGAQPELVLLEELFPKDKIVP